MKHILYIFKFISLVLFILFLCACGQVSDTTQDDTTSKQSAITVSAETTDADPAVLQSSIMEEQQRPTPTVGTAVAVESLLPWITLDDVTYRISKNNVNGSNQLCIYRINSSSEHITIPHDIPEYGKVIYVTSESLSIGNAKTSTFSEGIRGIDLDNNTIYGHYVENLQKIFLPSTMTVLIGNRRDTLSNNSLHAVNTFPNYFPSLQEIHVAENNPLYQSDNGILYQDDQLICIPQDYQTADGTVTIREGTTDLRDQSIYYCHNIKRLIVPDSVQNIHVFAISHSNQLTIVCSRNSVAAAYVKEMNNPKLIAEYTD